VDEPLASVVEEVTVVDPRGAAWSVILGRSWGVYAPQSVVPEPMCEPAWVVVAERADGSPGPSAWLQADDERQANAKFSGLIRELERGDWP
jgi:hypothetical protein